MPSRRRQVNAYDEGTALPVRYDAARRRADDGRRLLGGRQAPHRRRARRPRRRLRRGRFSGRQRHRHAISRRAFEAQGGEADRLRHDEALRPLGLQRPRLAGGIELARRRHLPRYQVVRLSRARGARHLQRGEPCGPRAVREGGGRDGPRVRHRLRTLLRRLQGKPAILARRGAYRLRGRRALGGAVRHQRRNAAARGRAHRRRGGEGRARHAPWHPHAQRHRECRRQHVDGGARRRAPHPGHAQRHRRALRQRQPDVDHPDAASQERVRRPFRDRRHARAATHADARQPHSR